MRCALAAINLVLFHFTHVYSVKYGYSSPLGFEWPYGAYGVEMFFILSGFVNSMSLMRRGQPTDFVAARLIRIIPFFLMAIVANIWILRLAPMYETIGTAQFLANMTLVPRILGYECVDPVMWTLQIEMMFYATLVVLFKIGALRRYFIGWGTLLALSLIVCPTLDAMEASNGGAAWFGFATSIRRLMLLDFVPLFAIGFLLYMIKTDTGKRWQNIAGILVAVGVFHSIDHGKHNPLATALIIGLVTLSRLRESTPVAIPTAGLRQHNFVRVVLVSQQSGLCLDQLLGSGWYSAADLFSGRPGICVFTFDSGHQSHRSPHDAGVARRVEPISLAGRQRSRPCRQSLRRANRSERSCQFLRFRRSPESLRCFAVLQRHPRSRVGFR